MSAILLFELSFDLLFSGLHHRYYGVLHRPMARHQHRARRSLESSWLEAWHRIWLGLTLSFWEIDHGVIIYLASVLFFLVVVTLFVVLHSPPDLEKYIPRFIYTDQLQSSFKFDPDNRIGKHQMNFFAWRYPSLHRCMKRV